MKAPRRAQWLIVSALTFGLSLGPQAAARAYGAGYGPSPTERSLAEDAEADEPGADESGAEAPTKSESSGDGEDPGPGAGAQTEPTSAELEESRSSAPGPGTAELDPGASVDGEAEPVDGGAEPVAGSNDVGPDAARSEGDPELEPAGSDAPRSAEPKPVITVRPGPVTSSSAGEGGVDNAPVRDVVVDPRRRFSDERIMLRASILAFGIAALAVGPTAFALNRGAYARRVLAQLETPSEASARAEVERYERTMNGVAIIAGAVGATSLLGGAVLLGVGLRGRSSARRATVAPVVGGGTAGVMLRGRF